MFIKSLTSALALTGVALATLSAASTLPTTASAAPFDPYHCQDIYDGTFKPGRSCTEAERRRQSYTPPPPRKPQDPPVLKNWRDGIFNQALNSGAGGDGGGGGGNR